MNKKITRPEEKWTWWDNLTFEVKYFIDNRIWYPWRSFRNGCSNLIKYRKIIWHDRWWDYYFLLNIILFKLKDMEKHWGTDTHYVNDTDEKEILQKLIKDLEWMLNENHADDFAKDETGEALEIKEQYKRYDDAYKKISKSFFGRLDRNHRKLWD
jgi:hypothetical protein